MTDKYYLCLIYKSHSQANFSHYTQKFISTEFEFAFVDLRYFLEDYRPNETTNFTLFQFKLVQNFNTSGLSVAQIFAPT